MKYKTIPKYFQSTSDAIATVQLAEAVIISEKTAKNFEKTAKNFKVIPNSKRSPRRLTKARCVIRRNWQLCPLHACKPDRPKALRSYLPTCPALPASLRPCASA